MKDARRLAGVFLVAALGLSGCAVFIPQTAALREHPPVAIPESIEWAEVPFFPQDEYQCGPAALATVLARFKPEIAPEDLAKEVYLPGRQGSLQIEMLAAPRRHGLLSYRLAPRLDDVLREAAAGNPVVVLQDFGVWPVSIWHYAVVVGYDLPRGELILRSGGQRRQVMPFAIHEYLSKESDYWAMVVVPPERLPATASETPYLASLAAFERGGNLQATRTAYGAALKKWPESSIAAIGLANSHYAVGELPQAAAVLRSALEFQPDSMVLLNNLAQTLSDLGRNQEALPLIERALALEAVSPAASLAAALRETQQLLLQRLHR